jgi:hypothetical protein
VREADIRLYSALSHQELCYVLTPRQMGKSSLMVRTAARLKQNGFAIAILDLTAIGQNVVAEQWYNGLLERMGRQLNLEDDLECFWTSRESLGPLQRWTAAVREVVLAKSPTPVVIFIDEIDAVRSLPFSTDEFFAGIREFYNRRTLDSELSRITFCLLGVATPSDLIRDTRTTPFNIGRRIELSDFSLTEASPLSQGLGLSAEEGEPLLHRVLYWTGGHPYLTQRLCQALAEERIRTGRGVDRTCNDLFLSHRARERDDNLLFVRERILRSDTDVASLLSLYGHVRRGRRVADDETNPLVSALRLSGITRVESGMLKVRNRIYSRVFDQGWVTANLPGAEVRRQRTAYIRGLKIGSSVVLAFLIAFAGNTLLGLFTADTSVRWRSVMWNQERWKVKPPVFWASAAQNAQLEKTGSLFLKTGNPNVDVYVNSVLYGKTDQTGSLEVPSLSSENAYTIRLEKSGFQPVSQAVQVVPHQQTQLLFKLEPQSQAFVGTFLALEESEPGAKVQVDSQAVGSVASDGTFTTKITAGEHSVVIEKEGFVSIAFKQQFGPGNTIINGKMKPDVEAREWAALAGSSDLRGIEDFLNHYPSGRFSEQARARAEQLAWSAVKDSTDETKLDDFIRKYPHGQFAGIASDKAKRLQQEDVDWRTTQRSHDAAQVQAFLQEYPQGRYSDDAKHLLDKIAVLSVLDQLAQSYNQRDLAGILKLWPDCPSPERRLLEDKTRGGDRGHLSLVPTGEPTIAGDKATVSVSRIRETSSSTLNSEAVFELRKSNDRWVIEKGAF